VTSSGPGDALGAIWERHREVVLARLDAIERAAVGEAGPEARGEAVRAAHQLAGTVGTFGFARATEMARELESRLVAPGTAAPELGALARGLRRELMGEVGGGERDAEPRRRSRGRVLAVDDDPLILHSVRSLLAERGLEVVTEGDPGRVLTSLPEIAPDLVILDIDMPGMNGIELCDRIRADPDHQQLPIVFLTTHTDAKTVRAAYRAGANGHVSKPVGDQLGASVERHKALRER
jgi:CheY-like chemotaxis protein